MSLRGDSAHTAGAEGLSDIPVVDTYKLKATPQIATLYFRTEYIF